MKTEDVVVLSNTSSVSSLGFDPLEVKESYSSEKTFFGSELFNGEESPVAKISSSANDALGGLLEANPRMEKLDRTVQLGILAASKLVDTEELSTQERIGVNLGSSRGATGLFEKYHTDFLAKNPKTLSPLTSPTTTLGNLSSSVGRYLNTKGVSFSHSITCSTSLHSILNGVAWLKAGMADRFIVGGSEAPLTEFTVAQMKALKIYSTLTNDPYPCRPCGSTLEHQNTMVLGEGAGLALLETKKRDELCSGDIIISGCGFAAESKTSATGMTKDGVGITKSMMMALESSFLKERPDGVILHAPGTAQGDGAELEAVRAVFGRELPTILSNKWKIGHTFGASGALSLEYGRFLLEGMPVTDLPYKTELDQSSCQDNIGSVIINGAGFGGNIVSIILTRIT